MARPTKKGLSYFPLDTDLFGNRKIQRLLNTYGCEGTLVFLALLCEIYSIEGYCIEFTENLCFDIGFTLRLEESFVTEILSFCVAIRLFDRKLFEEKKVLTSVGIQQRYLAINKRYHKAIDPVLVLVEKTPVSVTETTLNHTKTTSEIPVMVTEAPAIVTKTPTKGNIKEKESKEKNKTKKKDENQRQTSARDEESVRRAELCRMAEEATSGG